MSHRASYSIAIRTLGAAGDKFRMELESIITQTVQPERVMVYIAEGYPRPEFTVGREEYVWVKKGMVAQRALPYDDISSEYIMMLDDDVMLAAESAERMIKALEENDAYCVGADVFQNHKMPLKTKLYSALTNLVFPHRSNKWAFKIHHNGSFSYNCHPSKSFYQSQSCGGPATMWRKDAFLRLHMSDERWLDQLGFTYGEDALMTYKLHLNSGKLGVLYDSGITNLDAQSASADFKKSADYICNRTKASYMVWYRSLFRNGKDTAASRLAASFAFWFKALWLVFVMCGAALIKRDGRFCSEYFRGLREGRKAVHSELFKVLPPYFIKQ